MNANRYVRPGLSATRDRVPDAALEVGCWLDQLADILEGTDAQGPVDEAYDLLALWGKLRRVRPELLADPEAKGDLARLEGLVAERGPELAAQALAVPNPQGWLEEARAL